MKRHWLGLVGLVAWIPLASCGGSPSEAPKSATELTPIQSGAQPAVAPAASAKYACPMHAEETSDNAGAKCSKCGMEMTSTKDGAE